MVQEQPGWLVTGFDQGETPLRWPKLARLPAVPGQFSTATGRPRLARAASAVHQSAPMADSDGRAGIEEEKTVCITSVQQD